MDLEAQDRFAADIDWFLDHLLTERGASEHTIAAYSRDLRQAAAFFHKVGLSDWSALDQEFLSRFHALLGPPMAAATAQRKLSALRSFLKFLKRRGAGSATDLPSTGGFKKPRRLPKALPLEQLERLLAVPSLDKPSGLRDRALMELIYGAGLRVSEAVNLGTERLSLDTATVLVSGKRGKTRAVPLPSQTIEWLERYLCEARPKLAKRPLGTVLVSDRGRPMCRQVVHHKLARYAAACGIAHVSPHTLRHSLARRMLKHGAHLSEVQRVLGHSRLSTTGIYLTPSEDDLREAIGRTGV